mmetsp:Transcript_3821/g.4738  ORF Transcript_3821/g.4738 Transcript_3821/m.4738 type:complete len:110 (+) Transcript_3821:1162-1491(+)
MVSQLNRIFGGGKQPANEYAQNIYYDWSLDPFIRGGYMCVLSEEQRKTLFAFSDPQIFFAGESYSDSFSSVGGTHQSFPAFNVLHLIGALQSAMRAAEQVKQSYTTSKL